jgi:hypothetical protein
VPAAIPALSAASAAPASGTRPEAKFCALNWAREDIRHQLRRKIMPKIGLPARAGTALATAFASLTTFSAPIQTALADKPSTPVTVVNPAATPALSSDVDNPGRTPYQVVKGPEEGCGRFVNCTYDFPVVPAGHRLIIQHVSGSLFTTPSTLDNVMVTLSFRPIPTTTGLASIWFFAPVKGGHAIFDQPVLFYVESGSSAQVEVSTNFDGITADFGGVTLIGYMIDCANISCAPITN